MAGRISRANRRRDGTTNLTLEVSRLNADGTETVVASAHRTTINPRFNALAVKYDHADLVVNYGPPAIYRYTMKTDQGILAQASFNYTG
jgi:hypothetical protein